VAALQAERLAFEPHGAVHFCDGLSRILLLQPKLKKLKTSLQSTNHLVNAHDFIYVETRVFS